MYDIVAIPGQNQLKEVLFLQDNIIVMVENIIQWNLVNSNCT